MVSCKQCLTPNTLDSTFCKRCGTALPDDEVLAAKDKLNDLVAQGNTLFNEGRTDEAMAIAENALLAFPTSTTALSLKLLVHERRGELAEALESADQIVDLNPDSDLDKIRRNHLRNKLATSVQLAAQPPDRRAALMGATAAVILFVCLGYGVAKLVNRGDTPKPFPTVSKETQAPQQPVVQNQTQNQTQPQQVNSQPQNNQTQQQPNRFAQNGPNLSGFGISGQLPVPEDGGGPIEISSDQTGPTGQIGSGGNKPKNPNPVAAPTTTASPNTGNAPGDPAPTAVTDNKPADPGKIDIQLSQGSARSSQVRGSVDIDNGRGGAEALNRAGMQQYQLGQYSPAANAFEQALRAGGDQMSLNQRLAQCYSHLDRKSDAIDAYKKSIAACQQALSSGSGNKDSIQSRLDSCQQALKVLQGN